MIRTASAADAIQLCELYNPFVRDTVVTFEETPVAESDMAQRILDVTLALPWLVWEEGGAISGYTCARPWKTRSAYRYTVESTVYVAPAATGRGIGQRLYERLLSDLRALGVHSVVGGIALPNDASVALHEKLGFTPAGCFHEVGWKLGRWVDVGYWQRLL